MDNFLSLGPSSLYGYCARLGAPKRDHHLEHHPCEAPEACDLTSDCKALAMWSPETSQTPLNWVLVKGRSFKLLEEASRIKY